MYRDYGQLYHSGIYLGKDYSDGIKHWKYIKRIKLPNGKYRYYYGSRDDLDKYQEMANRARNYKGASLIAKNKLHETADNNKLDGKVKWDAMKKFEAEKYVYEEKATTLIQQLEYFSIGGQIKNLINEGKKFLGNLLHPTQSTEIEITVEKMKK